LGQGLSAGEDKAAAEDWEVKGDGTAAYQLGEPRERNDHHHENFAKTPNVGSPSSLLDGGKIIAA
jgi:hypothetical protein